MKRSFWLQSRNMYMCISGRVNPFWAQGRISIHPSVHVCPSIHPSVHPPRGPRALECLQPPQTGVTPCSPELSLSWLTPSMCCWPRWNILSIAPGWWKRSVVGFLQRHFMTVTADEDVVYGVEVCHNVFRLLTVLRRWDWTKVLNFLA